MAHFVLSDFLALSLDQMPAGKTAYPPGIPPTAPSASTAAMELGRVGSHQPVCFITLLTMKSHIKRLKIGVPILAYTRDLDGTEQAENVCGKQVILRQQM